MSFITRSTVSETYLERVRASGKVPAYQFKPTHSEMGLVGQWKTLTFKQFDDECRLVAFGLMGLGVEREDKVVILSNTRFEWHLSDIAILGAGAITVPIYASNLPDDVAHILNHSEAKVALVENGKQLEKLLEKRESLPFLKKIIVIEPSGMQIAAGRQDVLTLQALKEIGRREEAKEPGRFEKNLNDAKPDDLITICYTSGTTGVPKGAMITHDNMMSVLEDTVKLFSHLLKPEGEVVTTFLPFSHIIGKVESMAGHAFGWKVCYAQNLDTLMADIAETRPTLMFSVPRIFEKAYNRINAMVASGPAAKRALFDWAFGAGRDYYKAIWAGKTPSFATSAQFRLAQKLVLNKVAQRFGGRLKAAACGGAPLPREIGEYFMVAGIPIIEAYGLTETCAPVAMNSPEDPRFGAVGRPLPEVSIKIADDGEILVKSRKVFKGYYKMPSETRETINEQGWFHTGDIGHLDQDGFLKITDRKKDLIITSGGKNIAPQKIENIAKTQKFINQFVVHGDRRNYLTALVTLDRDQVIKYANEHQILFSEYGELVKHPRVQLIAQKAIDAVNSHLASFETIKKFVILPQDFSIENGEMTPSMKIKRGLVNKRYRPELDSMYAS